MRRLIVLVLAAMLVTFTGCGKFKEIKVNSVKMEKVSPYGLRGLNVGLAVEIDNPAVQIKLSDMEANIEYCGKVLGKVTVDPFVLKARTVESYDIKARMALDQSVSLYEALMFLSKDFAQNCILDMTAKGSLRGGLSKTITEKDVPLKKLMEYAE